MWIRVAEDGPTWANGCSNCNHGIVSAVVLNRLPLHLERAILAQHGRVVFCDCRAGLMARQYARRVWRDVESGKDTVNPDVVAALLLEASSTPTVHGPEPVFAQRSQSDSA